MFELLKKALDKDIVREFGVIQQRLKITEKKYKNGELSEKLYRRSKEKLMGEILVLFDIDAPFDIVEKSLTDAQKTEKQLKNIHKLNRSGMLTKEQAKHQMHQALGKYNI